MMHPVEPVHAKFLENGIYKIYYLPHVITVQLVTSPANVVSSYHVCNVK